MKNPSQLSFWTKEEIDFFFPRRKTKREILREEKEAFNKKLLERAVLSDGEMKKYSAPLKKENLINFFNNEIKEKYNSNLGVPGMLLTSLSQYSKKEQKDLFVSDLVIMYKSINNAFSEKEQIDIKQYKQFRKINNLSFFGGSQYTFMMEYIRKII